MPENKEAVEIFEKGYKHTQVNNELVISKESSISLTQEEYEKAKSIAQGLAINKDSEIISIGSEVLNQIGKSSETLLNGIQTADSGAVGELMTSLQMEFRNAPKWEEKFGFIGKLLGKQKKKIEEIQLGYQSIGTTIDKIGSNLTKSSEELLEYTKYMDAMKEENAEYRNNLKMTIVAIELKIEEMKQNLDELAETAKETNDYDDMQKFNDQSALIHNLDKRHSELIIAKAISEQTDTNLRIMKDTNLSLAEKALSLVNTAIPMWRTQAFTAVSLTKQSEIGAVITGVSDMTNQLIKSNADLIHKNSVETAKENERSIVDAETLQYANDKILQTVEDVLRIQQEGALKNKETERKVIKNAEEFNQKILNLSDDVGTKRLE